MKTTTHNTNSGLMRTSRDCNIVLYRLGEPKSIASKFQDIGFKCELQVCVLLHSNINPAWTSMHVSYIWDPVVEGNHCSSYKYSDHCCLLGPGPSDCPPGEHTPGVTCSAQSPFTECQPFFSMNTR